MKKQRLLKLAALLEADAANRKGIKFDLNIIACKSGYEPMDVVGRYHEGDDVPVNCGTAACAVGLAAISGAFKRSGFTYTFTSSGVVPKFGEYHGFGSADARFFGLSETENIFLFHPSKYPPNSLTGVRAERRVAKRIRDFVAGKVSPHGVGA